MRQLTELTNDYKQLYTVILEDNNTFELQLEYIDQQIGWFYTINYNDNFTIFNQRLVTGLNILRKAKNIIPFGLQCLTSDLSEVFLLDDFISGKIINSVEVGRVSLYTLNKDDVEFIENQFYV